jgi:hypothetical protein
MFYVLQSRPKLDYTFLNEISVLCSKIEYHDVYLIILVGVRDTLPNGFLSSFFNRYRGSRGRSISIYIIYMVEKHFSTSIVPNNPHWARVVGYGPFSLCIIHKEGLCPNSGDINMLMMIVRETGTVR